jgi:2'-5' RNA ligase
MGKTNWISLTLPETTRDAYYMIGQYLTQNIKTIVHENVDFIPMEYNDLHMTLVFCDDKLRKLSKEQKPVYESIMNQQIQSFKLKFDKYELFPPGKENIIIARFADNISFQKFVLKLRSEFSNIGIKFEENFIPHITLGKIRGFKKEYKRDNIVIPDPNIKEFESSSYYLCGQPIY